MALRSGSPFDGVCNASVVCFCAAEVAGKLSQKKERMSRNKKAVFIAAYSYHFHAPLSNIVDRVHNGYKIVPVQNTVLSALVSLIEPQRLEKQGISQADSYTYVSVFETAFTRFHCQQNRAIGRSSSKGITTTKAECCQKTAPCR